MSNNSNPPKTSNSPEKYRLEELLMYSHQRIRTSVIEEAFRIPTLKNKMARVVYIPRVGKKPREVVDFGPGVATILNVLYNRIMQHNQHLIHQNCYSYQPNLDRSQPIQKLNSFLNNKFKNKAYRLYKFDFSDYFNNISEKAIRHTIGQLTNLTATDYTILEDHLTNLTYTTNDPERPIITHSKMVLPQGSAVSSFFANACLYDFDVYFSQHFPLYLRFCDDFVLASDRPVQEVIDVVQEWSNKYELSINPAKTDIITYGQNITFLGTKFCFKQFPHHSQYTQMLSDNRQHKFKKSLNNLLKPYKQLNLPPLEVARQAIQALNHYLHRKQYYQNSKIVLTNFTIAIKDTNDYEYLIELDKIVQNRLKIVAYKANNAKSRQKLPLPQLRELGYETLVDKFKLYQQSPAAYFEQEPPAPPAFSKPKANLNTNRRCR